jgi:dihydropteroate synthase
VEVALSPLTFSRASFAWRRTVVMGVINVTPDSFSDGGRFLSHDQAVQHGRALQAAGADVIDVGGESTRPGSQPVTAAEEGERVVPVVRALAPHGVVSIDTYKASVADAALRAGAELVNDISGGTLEPEILKVVARHQAAVILGHLRGTPSTMGEHTRYNDVVREVIDELRQRVDAAVAAGVSRARVLIDPGLGFAKKAEHSTALLQQLSVLRAAFDLPIVIGASRKSFLGALTGREVGDRETATAAANAIAIARGANMVRVHDVQNQIDAIRVADGVTP